jgi:glutamine synthetase
MSEVVDALKRNLGHKTDMDEDTADHLPTRLEQALANMVEKVIAKQRLGQVKAMVRNQTTMEARDGN